MKYEEMRSQAIEMLKSDDDLFCDMVEELDDWNGYADGFRCYQMWQLDELFYDCKVSEFLDKLTSDFSLSDEYIINTIYGLSSTNNRTTVYRDNVDEEELLDKVTDLYNHLYFNDKEFRDLVVSIADYDEEEDA